MVIKATALRQNLYQLLDEVLETGKPIIIERNGKRLHISPLDKGNKLDRLEPHNSINGIPEDLLGLDWSTYWSEEKLKKTNVRKKKRG